MKRKLFLIAATAMAVTTQMWADDPLGSTQTVCQSQGFVYTNALPSGYSAQWDLSGAGTSGTDYTLTGNLTDAAITVVWNTVSNSRVMKSRDISGEGCVGLWKTTTVTVNPKPEVDDATATLCSTGQGSTDGEGTVTDDVYNMALATTDKNGKTITSWDISVSVPSGVTRTGATLPTTSATINADYIKNDKFENSSTTTNATVVYTVTPHIGDCVGDPYTITITVLPKVPEPSVTYRSI